MSPTPTTSTTSEQSPASTPPRCSACRCLHRPPACHDFVGGGHCRSCMEAPAARACIACMLPAGTAQPAHALAPTLCAGTMRAPRTAGSAWPPCSCTWPPRRRAARRCSPTQRRRWGGARVEAGQGRPGWSAGGLCRSRHLAPAALHLWWGCRCFNACQSTPLLAPPRPGGGRGVERLCAARPGGQGRQGQRPALLLAQAKRRGGLGLHARLLPHAGGREVERNQVGLASWAGAVPG